MRRSFLSVASVAVLALALASPASAITYGVPDGEGHPSVGALLAATAYSDGTWVTCTGTLVSPTVFVTAAHCDSGEERVAVTFDSVYNEKGGTTYWGTYHADPAYDHAQSDTHDLAVVVFDKPVRRIAPARLPEAELLTGLSGSQRFTSVGYGAQQVSNGPGGKQFSYQDVRYVSTGTLNSINATWLRISQNPSRGDGGTCYGDSGGPNFLGAGSTETNIVASTTITGDMFCRSTNVTYRLDTPQARGFLGQFVTLP
jgi:V8-like Glu-specific endopeptidase